MGTRRAGFKRFRPFLRIVVAYAIAIQSLLLCFGMVAIAAVNRLHFTPRLAQVANAFAARDALRRLRRNSVTELVIGQSSSHRRGAWCGPSWVTA
jgi:hypothetical protein